MDRFRESTRKKCFSGRIVALLVGAAALWAVLAGSALAETLTVNNQTSVAIIVKVFKGSGTCGPQEATFKAQKGGALNMTGCSISEVCVNGAGSGGVSAMYLGLVDVGVAGAGRQCTLIGNGSTRTRDAGQCSDGRAAAFHWQNLTGPVSGSSTLTCTE